MEVRPIDAEKYMELLKEQYLHHKSMGNNQAAKAWQGAMQLLYDMPTLAPPNEPLTLEGDGRACMGCLQTHRGRERVLVSVPAWAYHHTGR